MFSALEDERRGKAATTTEPASVKPVPPTIASLEGGIGLRWIAGFRISDAAIMGCSIFLALPGPASSSVGC
jgi:hypothetical protein